MHNGVLIIQNTRSKKIYYGSSSDSGSYVGCTYVVLAVGALTDSLRVLSGVRMGGVKIDSEMVSASSSFKHNRDIIPVADSFVSKMREGLKTKKNRPSFGTGV